MKLLVSPADLEEAKAAIAGGADIIDLKNPREGSLGASFPRIIRQVKALLPEGLELSAALGDLAFKPGTASLAAYAAASLGADYAKAGLFGIRDGAQGLELARELCRAVEGTRCRIILAGYAEYAPIGSISPFLLPEVAREAGAAGVMIDTARKDGKGLFQHLPEEEVKAFVDGAHDLGLLAALAGSLGMEGARKAAALGADIVGVRGLVCTGGDRSKRIEAGRVLEVKAALS